MNIRATPRGRRILTRVISLLAIAWLLPLVGNLLWGGDAMHGATVENGICYLSNRGKKVEATPVAFVTSLVFAAAALGMFGTLIITVLVLFATQDLVTAEEESRS